MNIQTKQDMKKQLFLAITLMMTLMASAQTSKSNINI
ncbi:MAG: hypothetical protein AUK63_2381 [bacterium P3]|jgi:hypothetical protein|nr:MAG: hypothetical protein AUK63_2381 [bacterium P3]KWW27950.1 MAG: hypothetical protein F083_2914 [bacterium F083]